jgi:hypothetical protein
VAKTIFLIGLFTFTCNASAQYLSNGIGSILIGGYGSVFVHEAGHALSAISLGKEIEFFRPYPSKVRWKLANGQVEEKWALGIVKIKSDKDEQVWENNSSQAIYSAMGSGANALAVLLLSPLLPELSGFGAQTLDDMLLFSTFDLPVYALADLLGLTKGTGDWSQVAAATKIPIFWWFLGSVRSYLLN